MRWIPSNATLTMRRVRGRRTSRRGVGRLEGAGCAESTRPYSSVVGRSFLRMTCVFLLATALAMPVMPLRVLWADRDGSPEGDRESIKIELLNARYSVPSLHRAYEVLKGGNKIGTVELFEEEGALGLECIEISERGQERVLFAISNGDLRVVEVPGKTDRTAAGARHYNALQGPLASILAARGATLGVDLGVLRPWREMVFFFPWHEATGDPLDLDAFGTLATERRHMPLAELVSDAKWSLEGTDSGSVHLSLQGTARIILSRRDGFPELCELQPHGLLWRAVAPQVQQSEWRARIASRGDPKPRGADAEALDASARSRILCVLLVNCLAQHPEYWRQQYVLSAVASAAVQVLYCPRYFMEACQAVALDVRKRAVQAAQEERSRGLSEQEVLHRLEGVLENELKSEQDRIIHEFSSMLSQLLPRVARELGRFSDEDKARLDRAGDLVISHYSWELRTALALSLRDLSSD